MQASAACFFTKNTRVVLFVHDILPYMLACCLVTADVVGASVKTEIKKGDKKREHQGKRKKSEETKKRKKWKKKNQLPILPVILLKNKIKQTTRRRKMERRKKNLPNKLHSPHVLRVTLLIVAAWNGLVPQKKRSCYFFQTLPENHLTVGLQTGSRFFFPSHHDEFHLRIL